VRVVPAEPFYLLKEHFAIDLPSARVVFTTRRGGHSTGPFQSLNLGRLTDDDPDAVERNRATVEADLGIRLGYVHQVHGEIVHRLAKHNSDRHAASSAQLPRGDGLVSTDPPRARDLLIVFAEFTRYSLRSVAQTTLAEELENIERYLPLQRSRFRGRLRVQLDGAPAALPVALPFLAVQQLVDNAVRNGIERKQLGGTVTISARLQGPDCLITVADDGPGIQDADLQDILGTIDDQLRDGFGERASLVADFVPGTGTTISIRVPSVPRGVYSHHR